MIFEKDNKQVLFQGDYEPQFSVFHDLIKERVREILLVSSLYDAFVLEEDGNLSVRIFSEYVDLNLRYTPRITRVSSALEGLEKLKNGNFDLVITMTGIPDMKLCDFGEKAKVLKPGVPIILLIYEWVGNEVLTKLRETQCIDKIFYWMGDARILLAIIKYIEDLMNVENDTKQGVRVILTIEDSPRFYSMFLPKIYTEIMRQTRSLIGESVNDLHKLLRMRARPKILMAETFEQGMELYDKYKENLLGVISDISFPKDGNVDNEAGFKFANKIKGDFPDLPYLLHSSTLNNRDIAQEKGLSFLDKNSENLLEELQDFILDNFGFGDFVFKDKEGGKEISRASDLHQLCKSIKEIPSESVKYHAKRNHISIWLRARTEFEAATKLRPMKISDFGSVEELRKFILEEIQKIINRNQSGVIADFGQIQFHSKSSFIRLGNGSLGGKARGIAFLNTLLAKTDLQEKFKDVDIRTPRSLVLCSGIFEEFVKENDLQEFAISENDNDKIARKFIKGKFSKKIKKDLKTILETVGFPLAVRSSSLLEDSQLLPFAGLYSTYILPNNHPDIKVRLKQLGNAVKLVFASVFYKSPKEYARNTNFRIEEEKMAVIIQETVGQNYNNKFYPVVSGVAQSYNFYPISHMEKEDGIVQLAFGLGSIVVEGSQAYRFSPRYPEMNPPYSSPAEFLENSQSYFYALDLSDPDVKVRNDEKFSFKKLNVADAEEDGTLFFVASTYSAQDDVIRDTISIEGPRVIRFANLLKYNLFPMAEILEEILKIGEQTFGTHVEIEFAVNLYKDKTRKPEFNLLQIRPLVAGKENGEIEIGDVPSDEILCVSQHTLGNGVYQDIYDIVYVDPETFNKSKTRSIAAEIGQLNQKFIEENRNYVLIGFGRWGTSDPWLGIPVDWFQISKAAIIIESNLDGFNIEPSQGSHFFHNMISLNLGYFHVRRVSETEFVSWEWIKNRLVSDSTKHVKHIRFSKPLVIKINARESKGIILKPDGYE